MRRLLTTIVLVIIALYVGAYVGKEKMNKFYVVAGEKIVKVTKNTVIWITDQWSESDIRE